MLASLVFYAWGEVFYVAIMLASIAINYLVGLLIARQQFADKEKQGFLILSLGVALNIALLVSFKYANFIVDNLNVLLGAVKIPELFLAPVHLPLGISFFTFQAISYIVDVYRREALVQRNIFDLALYIALFPQLIAGPIVRYHDIASQILRRDHSFSLFASGVQRFVMGLAKKMLVANVCGEVADNAFALSNNDLTMPLAWIGIFAYTLQIYFDFSGYSDMAIGLGRMFGFRFLENFNYPYISRSLREFWRRWHISLSTWFRDYVYIALGGNRVSKVRVYLNLLVVFLLTGIWHGASWNFVVWGLFHGAFLAAEHRGFAKVLERLPSVLQYGYVLFAVVIAWVFFRADNLSHALAYLSAMFDISAWETSTLAYSQLVNEEFMVVSVLGILLSMPLYPFLQQRARVLAQRNIALYTSFCTVRFAGLFMLLLLSVLKVASSTYNPFIYFRF